MTRKPRTIPDRSRVWLRGKSLKGKNRIREHGDTWLVLRDSADGKLLIQSPTDANHLRWVGAPGQRDSDFLVEWNRIPDLTNDRKDDTIQL